MTTGIVAKFFSLSQTVGQNKLEWMSRGKFFRLVKYWRVRPETFKWNTLLWILHMISYQPCSQMIGRNVKTCSWRTFQLFVQWWGKKVFNINTRGQCYKNFFCSQFTQVGSCLTHKRWTRLKRLPRDKPNQITKIPKFVNYRKKVLWHPSQAEIPRECFSIFVANEFFDALPVHKFVKVRNDETGTKVWREVLVDIVDDLVK
jgi:hypothetical protein